MKVISKFTCLAALAILAGCGGGSSGGAFGDAAGAATTAGPTSAKAAEVEVSTDAVALAAADGGKQAAAVQKLDASWVRVAGEGQSFTVASGTVVQYGSGSSYVQKTVSGTASCSNAFFGSDPSPMVAKECFVQSGTSGSGGTSTLLANEGGSFTVAATTTVKYGAGSSWIEKSVTGSATCGNAYFGSDPAPFVAKACYSVGSTVTKPETGSKLAGEGENFSVASATTVQYGADTRWVQKSVSGTATCSSSYFGSDPAPFVVKACYSLGSTGDGGSVAPTPPPITGGGTTPVVGDIVDGSLNVVGSSYKAMAAQLSKDAGIAYRYGGDAASHGVGSGGLPTLYARDQATMLSTSSRTIPAYWQVGGPPVADPGFYSTAQANLVFVADNPGAALGKGGLGVTDFQVSGYMHNVYMQLPQLSWTQAMANGGGIDSINAMDYKAAGLTDGNPIAVGRCTGRSGFCNESLVVFQNGLIGAVGSNTAGNNATVKLPADKVPTGIALTNNSEFALVTVWDTTNTKGQVAVVALAGLCDRCDPWDKTSHTKDGFSYDAWHDYWDEWGGVHPGLMNMGNIAYMKILGYVDLPGMAAPTEIAVTTGMDQWKTMYPDGTFVGWETPLSNQSNRESFRPNGRNYDKTIKGGVAVVISKSEQKAAFIDLKPLFDYFAGVYFEGDQATFNSRMGTLRDPNGFPYSFTQQPSQMPKVVKTVTLGAKPTAVKTTVFETPSRAWIATEDGTLHIYSLDGYALGGVVPAPSASAFTEVGTVSGIGRNPTSLATSKGEPSGNSATQVLVNSRGDRKISWVRFAANGNSGSIVRTLQDTRMGDPIAVEDGDNFFNTGNLLSVADYGGKAVRNYRYGPIIFGAGGACPPPNGCPTTGSIEYAGSLALPGKPYQLLTANVP